MKFIGNFTLVSLVLYALGLMDIPKLIITLMVIIMIAIDLVNYITGRNKLNIIIKNNNQEDTNND